MNDVVWLPLPLVRRIVVAATRAGGHETGGMLVGYEGADRAGEMVVTQLIAAGPRAKRGEFDFNPDGRWQRGELARVYQASGRLETFLGDWHSHPHGLPLPSETDVKTAARTATNERARAPRPLTMIVGREKEEWLLAAFRYVEDRLRPARLRVFDPDHDNLLTALEPRRALWPRLGRSPTRDLGRAQLVPLPADFGDQAPRQRQS
jgi:integrative and conjugative element protein (TIGR02256 family)